jgi:hypothetical protein
LELDILRQTIEVTFKTFSLVSAELPRTAQMPENVTLALKNSLFFVSFWQKKYFSPKNGDSVVKSTKMKKKSKLINWS